MVRRVGRVVDQPVPPLTLARSQPLTVVLLFTLTFTSAVLSNNLAHRINLLASAGSVLEHLAVSSVQSQQLVSRLEEATRRSFPHRHTILAPHRFAHISSPHPLCLFGT